VIFSKQIQKELQQFTSKHLPNTKLRYIHNTCKLQHQFNVKDKQHLLMRNNVVYRLNCSCGSFYFSQTRRNLFKRLEEHRTCSNAEVHNHLQTHGDHSIDFKNPQILTHSNNKYKLLILESLYIQLLKPDLNIDSVSFPLRIFNA